MWSLTNIYSSLIKCKLLNRIIFYQMKLPSDTFDKRICQALDKLLTEVTQSPRGQKSVGKWNKRILSNTKITAHKRVI